MAARGPILLFIGRESNGDATWRKVCHFCQAGGALRASDAYKGMALALQYPGLRAAVVSVDGLSEAEMSFISSARRHRPDLKLLAVGKGNELSNPRLAEATWQGAEDIATAEQLEGKLAKLMGTEPVKVAAVRGQQVAVEEKVNKETDSFLESRTLAQAKRKAPSVEPSKEIFQRESQDIVTPEELRVLLGEDSGQTDASKEAKR